MHAVDEECAAIGPELRAARVRARAGQRQRARPGFVERAGVDRVPTDRGVEAVRVDDPAARQHRQMARRRPIARQPQHAAVERHERCEASRSSAASFAIVNGPPAATMMFGVMKLAPVPRRIGPDRKRGTDVQRMRRDVDHGDVVAVVVRHVGIPAIRCERNGQRIDPRQGPSPPRARGDVNHRDRTRRCVVHDVDDRCVGRQHYAERQIAGREWAWGPRYRCRDR